MYFEVLELGYGNDIAKMNGSAITCVMSNPVTDSSGIVVGFINYYDASGFLNGSAEVKSTSINYPYNTEVDLLSIK